MGYPPKLSFQKVNISCSRLLIRGGETVLCTVPKFTESAPSQKMLYKPLGGKQTRIHGLSCLISYLGTESQRARFSLRNKVWREWLDRLFRSDLQSNSSKSKATHPKNPLGDPVFMKLDLCG